MSIRLLLIICSLAAAIGARSQASIGDSTIAVSIVSVEFAGHVPQADMADRFGANMGAGLGYSYKFASNWMVGFHGTYLFGNIVKNQQELLKPLRTSNGVILNSSGEYANILIQERGLHLSVFAEKIFPVIGPNPNSGLFVRAGAGFMEHMIWLEARRDDVPQVEDDISANYDRLNAGFSLSQMIGYRHMGNNRLVNFFIGIEAIEGFMSPQRAYNIDLMGPEEDNRFDVLLGIRAGWTLLFYKRKPNEFYYN